MASRSKKPKTQTVSEFELAQINENTGRVRKLNEVAAQLQEQTKMLYALIDDRYGCSLSTGEDAINTDGEIIPNPDHPSNKPTEETDG